eukprot:TRINITY_DN6254_c0_g1_i1.p1 TRINITY_DN6254_c0_g1~~TRINITY_DN6254_c0_g1_i1.p1  ORF type:complete len:750 (+),score=68.79 TRINITY_DN6254_c0_g1_i1:43-2292(+)
MEEEASTAAVQQLEQKEAQIADTVQPAWRNVPLWRLLHDSRFRLRFSNKLCSTWLTLDERYAHYSSKMDYVVEHKWHTLWRRRLISAIRNFADVYRCTGLVPIEDLGASGAATASAVRTELRSGVSKVGGDPDYIVSPRTTEEAAYSHTADAYSDSVRWVGAARVMRHHAVAARLFKLWRIANWCWGIDYPQLSRCKECGLSLRAYLKLTSRLYLYFVPGITAPMAMKIARSMWPIDVCAANADADSSPDGVLTYDAFCLLMNDFACSWSGLDTDTEYLSFTTHLGKVMLPKDIVTAYKEYENLAKVPSMPRTRASPRASSPNSPKVISSGTSSDEEITTEQPKRRRRRRKAVLPLSPESEARIKRLAEPPKCPDCIAGTHDSRWCQKRNGDQEEPSIVVSSTWNLAGDKPEGEGLNRSVIKEFRKYRSEDPVDPDITLENAKRRGHVQRFLDALSWMQGTDFSESTSKIGHLSSDLTPVTTATRTTTSLSHNSLEVTGKTAKIRGFVPKAPDDFPPVQGEPSETAESLLALLPQPLHHNLPDADKPSVDANLYLAIPRTELKISRAETPNLKHVADPIPIKKAQSQVRPVRSTKGSTGVIADATEEVPAPQEDSWLENCKRARETHLQELETLRITLQAELAANTRTSAPAKKSVPKKPISTKREAHYLADTSTTRAHRKAALLTKSNNPLEQSILMYHTARRGRHEPLGNAVESLLRMLQRKRNGPKIPPEEQVRCFDLENAWANTF